jgi:hypothetical protein
MKKIVFVLILLVSCSPTLPTYEVKFSGNSIQVPVNNFDNSTFNVIHDGSAPFDILLVKDSPGGYHSLYLSCSNDHEALDPSPALIVCPACGSTYGFDGSVKKGPAEVELVKFPTELNPDQTLVRIDIESLRR